LVRVLIWLSIDYHLDINTKGKYLLRIKTLARFDEKIKDLVTSFNDFVIGRIGASFFWTELMTALPNLPFEVLVLAAAQKYRQVGVKISRGPARICSHVPC